jgi:Protein of unknown function (DUF1449)
MMLLEWWNFLFAAPLVAGVVFAVIVVFTGLGGEGHHGDGDAHAGHGDSSEFAHTDGHGSDGDASSHDQPFDLLGWFGIGRGVSLSVMLPVLLASWGLSGLVLNQLFAPVLRTPNLYAPLAALGALLGAAFVGRNFARAFRRFSDSNRKTSVHTGELVGCRGTAVFEIDASGGAANIRDPFGNIHRVSARTNGERIEANSSITVQAFQNGIYLVTVNLHPSN